MKKKKHTMLTVVSIAVVVVSAVLLGGILAASGIIWKPEETNPTMAESTERLPVEEETQEGEDDVWTEPKEETEPEVTDFTMFFTGDIMLQRCTDIYEEEGIQGILSAYLQQEMTGADMTVINNEFPFSTRGTQHPDKQFTFRVNPKYVSALQDMGVDVASLSNNHALDFGTEALSDTFRTLDEAGIPYVGAGETKERAEEAIFVTSGERTVGVLAASRVIPVVEWNIENRQPGLFCTYDSTRLTQRIQEVKEQCDYVVVFVHWGIERNAYPEEYQRNLAKQYIDAGADLVVGNHAHVPQGIEYYNGVPIVYCLGNFIFNPDMTDTYTLKVVWDSEGKSHLQVIPIGTNNYYTSELTGEDQQAFYKYLEGISFGITIDENGMVAEE